MSPAAAAAGGGERRRPIASVRDGRSRGGGCGGPAGAALLGLSLFGLVLYLVPAAAALAWLAVGATAAWWGLSREPRGSRALSSLVRNARRQRTLHASPPAKSAVNGNLLEPRSLLEGPDPAELLLMGSYLGKPGPPQPAPAPEARDLLERPGRRRTPARAAPPAPSAHRVHHIYPSLPTPLLRSSRRPSLRDCGSLSNRFVITPRRRYPIQQAQYSLLGVLPTVCWNGYHKKAVLSPRNSKMVCSPVTVRIAPPDSKWTRSPIPEQTINSTLSSPSSNAPDPCAKETVLSALKERKKRTVEEEDQIFSDSQENKRRRHDSSGSGHSAFEPLVANGVPASFVPNLTGLVALPQHRRTFTHGGRIFSSICCLSLLWKRSGPSSSPFSSPASSRSQTPERPAKKIREDELSHRSSSSTPLATDKEAPGEKAADTSTWKAQTSCSSPPTPGSSGRRRRRVQLLPSRRGARLTLPPPPQLGYSITAEDLDLEKRASLQWFNKALADGTDTASSSVAEKPPATQPSLTFTLPAAGTTASPATLPAPCSSPLLESLKKMQSCAGLSSAPESTGVATTVAPLPPKTPSLLAPLGSSQSGPLPGTSSDSKNAAPFLGLTPAASPTPATDTTRSPPAPQAETSAKSPAPAARSPTPKESLLLGMLSTPPADPPASTAPAVSSASPMFKPIFVAPPKSENESPLPSSPSKVPTTTPSSSALPAPASSPQPTFKPVFGSMGPPTSAPLSAPFPFGQTAALATATSSPLFAGQATAASAVAPVAPAAPASTASTSADSASKPTFSFGVSGVTSTTTSAAAPFLFGAPPASGASFSPAVGSVFQFGKPPPAFGSAAQSAFGGLKPAASAFGTAASTQPAFGSGTPVFSFGAATTSGFGATTQTTSSGTSGSVFGGTALSPFTFGGSAGAAGGGSFGINVAAPGTSGAFRFGTGQSGSAGGTTPFGGGLSQSTLGAPSQSTPFAFNVAGTPESKPVFGGTSTPTFGQNTPAPGVGASGSGLSFGASSTPTQGFVGVGPFGSAAPSFSIGAGSKTPGARQRLQARRQHARKK
ncbi:nuclear envelope pore membrane protein POM 121 [Leptonychotes weddellii]|uniref:Nuclear envelope pore membrane protein POM 121 n=1 Tax=Leptonychotes weddellii TaxID=9713 RepID=A0A7F8RQ55_LEPWE|nr:nuclear envelope pore membrane protein POM 121 [Leptonychotes weddellii]